MESDLANMRTFFPVQTSWISEDPIGYQHDHQRLVQVGLGLPPPLLPCWLSLSSPVHLTVLTFPPSSRTQHLSLLSSCFLAFAPDWAIHSSLHKPTYLWFYDCVQSSISSYDSFSSSLMTILHSCPHSRSSKSNMKVISSGKSDHSKGSPKVYPLPHQIILYV